MSGNRYLFDTNAIVQLLQGNGELMRLAHGAEQISISVIAKLEFLCFPRLKNADKALFESFLSRVDICGLPHDDPALINEIVHLRIRHGLKLPDAIIAATAVTIGLRLVTADKALLTALPGCVSFSVI